MTKIGILTAVLLMFLGMIPVAAEPESFVFMDPYTLFYTDDQTLYDCSGSTVLKTDAWRGETVILKAYMKADRDMNLAVSAGPLQGEGTSYADAVTLSFLQTVSASEGVGDAGSFPHVNVPDLIAKKEKYSAVSGEEIYLYGEVNIPADAREGMYVSEIKVNGEKQLEIQINVLPYVLKEDVLTMELWQYPHSALRYYDILENAEAFDEAHLSVLRRQMETYHEAGGRNITVTVTDEPWGHQTYDDCPSMVKWLLDDAGQLSFDYSDMDAWIGFCAGLGIDERIDLFGILPFTGTWNALKPDGSYHTYSASPGSAEWEEVWTVFLEDLTAHMESLGLLEKTYIAVDERDPADMQAAAQLVKKVSGGRMKTAAAVNDLSGDFALFDRLAVSVAAFQKKEDEMRKLIKERKEAGQVTLLYNCSTNYPNVFALSQPAESIWTMEYLYGLEFDGYMRWAYDAWTEDPYRDLDWMYFESGDTMLVYPDHHEAADPDVFPSYRLKIIGKGIDTVTKTAALKEMLEEADRAVLDRIMKEMYRGYGNWNAYGAMCAKNDNTKRLIRMESAKADEAVHLCEKILAGDEKASAELKKLADRRSLLEAAGIDISWDGIYLKYNRYTGMIDLACMAFDLLALLILCLKKRPAVYCASACLAAGIILAFSAGGELVLFGRMSVLLTVSSLFSLAVLIRGLRRRKTTDSEEQEYV